MTHTARAAVVGALILTPLLTALSGCCCPSEEEMAKMKEQQEAKLAAQKDEIKSYYKKLKKIKKNIPDDLKQKKCSSKAIASAQKDAAFGGRLMTLDVESLDYLTASTFDEGRKRELEPWKWIRSREVAELRHVDDIPDATIAGFVLDDIEKAKKQPLFGVIVSERRSMPVVPEGTSDFTVGHYDGWIVVVAQKTGKPVCQVAFSATNSDTIAYKKGKLMGDQYNAEEATRDDFLENFEKSANGALDKIGKGLRVNLGLFQL